MFLWLETVGEGWSVAEFSEGDLVSLLRGSRAGVRWIVYPFATNGVRKGPVAVDREDFPRTLLGERDCPDEKAAEHEFPPLIPAEKEYFW